MNPLISRPFDKTHGQKKLQYFFLPSQQAFKDSVYHKKTGKLYIS